MINYMNNFLSTADVGRILDVSRLVVNNWVRKGYIKYSLVGHLQKIRAEDLLEYLKNLGNSEAEIIKFEKDIENYLKQKKEVIDDHRKPKSNYRT